MIKFPTSLCAVLLAVLLTIFVTPTHVLAQDSGATAESAAPALSPEVTRPDIALDALEIRLVPLTKDELAALAAQWLQIAKAATEQVSAAQLKLIDSAQSDAGAVREQLAQFKAKRRQIFEKYSAVIDAWEQKGGDEKAIADYRSYRNAVTIEEARKSDFRTLLSQLRMWLTDPDGGLHFAITIAVIIFALMVLMFLARLAKTFARGWFEKVPNLSKLLQAFLVTLVYWLVIACGLLIVASAVGIDISPVFALIGGASFIMAFAFQDTLGNLASGLMIMVNRPFDEGDYVDIGGVGGTVQAVNIVATKVITPDNQVIVVPNKQVWGNVITNVTASPTRRVDMVFGIGYGDDIETAQRVLEKVVADNPLVLVDPAPVIRISELADSSVNFIVRPWVKSDDYWTVQSEITRQVKQAFDANGISIPFPQQDVYMHHVNAPPAAGSVQGD